VRPPKIHAVLRDQRGMTLIELVIVVIVLAILLMVATASYASYRERASDSAAQSNLYGIMTIEVLKARYDAAIDPTLYSFGSVPPTATTYCIQSSSGDRTWRKNAPSAELERLPCP
jgi:prepilin-type N-terminal cleavage/methylation domain-containing protein